MERPIERLTLREMFTDAERLERELLEHLELGFIPKAHALTRLVRPGSGDNSTSDVKDVTIRNHAAQLIDSESFTDELYGKITHYTKAIDAAAARVLEQQ